MYVLEKEYALENEEKEENEKYFKHKFHYVINYTKILPNLKEIKINFNELKNKINEFKEIITSLQISKFDIINKNIECFYGINKNTFDSPNTEKNLSMKFYGVLIK